MIRTRNLEASESAAVVESLTKSIGNNTVKRIETVGAVIGSGGYRTCVVKSCYSIRSISIVYFLSF